MNNSNKRLNIAIKMVKIINEKFFILLSTGNQNGGLRRSERQQNKFLAVFKIRERGGFQNYKLMRIIMTEILVVLGRMTIINLNFSIVSKCIFNVGDTVIDQLKLFITKLVVHKLSEKNTYSKRKVNLN